MCAAYGPFAASATGGNDFARDFLAGISALYAHSFYENVGPKEYHLIYPSTILACLGIVVVIPIYIFYARGRTIRLKSRFAQQIENARQERIAAKRKRSTRGGSGVTEKDAAAAAARHVEGV